MKSRIAIIAALALSLTTSAFAATNVKEMFTEGTGRGEIKFMDFTKDYDTAKTKRDSAFGGLLYYKTAPLYGISFGTAFATTNNIGDNDSDSVYGLLGRNDDGSHKSVTRMQEYYIQGDWFKTQIKYGAQEVNTPMMHTHQIRLLPRSYKGLSVVNNSVNNLTLSGYYITDSLGWADEDFVSISDAAASGPAGSVNIDDNPFYIFGANYKLPVESVNSSVQAWYYTMPDVFNEQYFDISVSKDLGGVTVYTKPTLLLQKSQGDELVGDFSTEHYGLSLGAKYYGFDLTGFYAKTGDDALLDKWGASMVVIQQVLNSCRAEEDVYAARLAYDFGKLGLKGLSAYVFYAKYDTPETGSNASADMAETDYSIQYDFGGALQGFGVRARYATIDVDDGDDYDDTRFYVTYKFSFGGKK
ncbi:MAG: OprD family outer membrane porin [Deferribacterales bacterium]